MRQRPRESPAAPPPALKNPARGRPRAYLNDGDNDPSADNDLDDSSGIDNDSDYVEDHRNPENNLYHDKDDIGVLDFGSPASAADSAAVTVLVKRYYAAGAADDGGSVCAMMIPIAAQSLSEDYGKPPGPRAPRGAKTCAAVMSLLFKHFVSRFTSAFAVTGVRVDGEVAYALLGSKTGQASFIILKREGGSWKLDGLLAGPLP